MNDRKWLPVFNRPVNGSPRGGGMFRTAMARPAAPEPAPTTVSDEVTAMKRQLLGAFDRFAVKRQSRTEARNVVATIIVNMLEAQKDVILHRLMLDVAGEKKRALVEAMREGAKKDLELIELSTRFEAELHDFVHKEAIAGWERQRHYLERLDAERSAGKIGDDAYAAEEERIRGSAIIFRDNLDGRLTLILTSHVAQIERTLKLFVEQQLAVEKL